MNSACSFISMGKKQAELFMDNNLVYIECLVKFNSPRMLMLAAYARLVGLGKVKPIEALPIHEKNQLWETTKEFASGRMEKEKALELAKALYTLEYFMQ